MNKKTDKVMVAVKNRSQQKEQVGGQGKFNPVHRKQQHGEDPNSPNQYKPVEEAIAQSGTSNSLGSRHKPRKNIFKSELLPSQRTAWQHSGNQKMANTKGKPVRYTEEEAEITKKVLKKVKRMKEEQGAAERTDKLGRPDTGGTQDTVTVNPKKRELTGPLR
jgi:hypothetical protein